MNRSNESAVEDPPMENIYCTQQSVLAVLSIVVMTIVMIATLFGNTLILVTLRRFSSHFKGNMFTFIGSLAVADIFMVLTMGLQIIKMSSRFSGMTFSGYLCATKGALAGISVICSGLTLIFMSLDRFCAVVFPIRHLLRNRRNPRRAKLIVAGIWIVSISLALTSASFYFRNLGNSCIIGEIVPRTINITLAVFLVFQSIFNLILFAIVLWKIKSQPGMNEPTSSRDRINKRQNEIKLDKAKLMARVYVVFAVCWTPFITFSLLTESTSSPDTRQKYVCAREYSVLLGCINSGLNWMIYGLANKRFRQGFKEILCFSRSQGTRLHLFSLTSSGRDV